MIEEWARAAWRNGKLGSCLGGKMEVELARR